MWHFKSSVLKLAQALCFLYTNWQPGHFFVLLERAKNANLYPYQLLECNVVQHGEAFPGKLQKCPPPPSPKIGWDWVLESGGGQCSGSGYPPPLVYPYLISCYFAGLELILKSVWNSQDGLTIKRIRGISFNILIHLLLILKNDCFPEVIFLIVMDF